MYKYLMVIASAFILSSCSIVDDETHDMYNDIPAVDIVIDTDNITHVNDQSPLSIYVLADGEPVDDADITLTMWAAKEAEVWSVDYDVSHKTNGEYSAKLEIPREGLYLIKTHIKNEDIDAMPTKYFTVGELDMFEEVFLQEFSSDEDIDIHSHH